MRQRQGDVARVLRLAERLPGGVLDTLEDLGQVARAGQLGEAVEVEQLAGSRAEMNGACAAAATFEIIFEQAMSSRVPAELVVADEHAVRLAAELAVLLLVDLLEQRALVELDGLLQVLEQVLLADVQDADLELLAGLGLVDEVVQAAPGGFQLLELRGVHDLVELRGELLVDLGDPDGRCDASTSLERM